MTLLQALKSLPYTAPSDNAERLLRKRYYQKTDGGTPLETWPDVCKRIVDNVCGSEEPEFQELAYLLLLHRVFIPNTPCIANAGSKNGGLFACFVLSDYEDTLDAHCDALKEIAQVAKKGGGCGFSGTSIRPENSPVAGSAHGRAYGPILWAQSVSKYLDMITQGDKLRKMALMFTLRCDHQDFEKFLDMKQNMPEDFCYNFNQSPMVTDAWMKLAVVGGTEENRLLTKIATNAWNNGEPGVLFYDTINSGPYSVCGCGTIECSNPCSEQVLPDHGSCNLGSINVSHRIFFGSKNEYNNGLLADVTIACTRVLDDVGGANKFPNAKFEEWYRYHRPIGIGVMGFADALLKLGIPYGSEIALSFESSLMLTLNVAACYESERLGNERGIPEHCKGVGRRNITCISIAPTGSIAQIADCSYSIEPIFSPSYTHTDESGEVKHYKHPESDAPYFRSTINSDTAKVPHWRDHVMTLATAQKYCDSSISKTINMSHDATIGDVLEAYKMAWEIGCKGLTVYRDGSRQKQVLRSEEVTKEQVDMSTCPTGVCKL